MHLAHENKTIMEKMKTIVNKQCEKMKEVLDFDEFTIKESENQEVEKGHDEEIVFNVDDEERDEDSGAPTRDNNIIID